MAEASLIRANLSPPEVAVDGGRFSGVGKIVRSLLLARDYENTIQSIQKAFRVSRRTAERIYAGQSVSGETTLAIILHEGVGGPYLAEALNRLPAEERAAVADGLKDAAESSYHKARQEILALKQAELQRKLTALRTELENEET